MKPSFIKTEALFLAYAMLPERFYNETTTDVRQFYQE